MDQEARELAFLNALATELFVLQAARSAIVGEQVGRATIYMGAVSGVLIAFGFLAQVVERLDPFVAAALPALFVLGELTFGALRRNTIENIVLLQRMHRIRAYYRRLVPDAQEFFDAPDDAEYETAIRTIGLRPAALQMLFTGATMVAAINSIVGGTGVALVAARFGHAGDGPAAAIGLVVAVLVFLPHLLYQQRTSPPLALVPH